MNLLKYFSYGIWNIGFIIESDTIITGKPLQIEWMKHNYKISGFADPFILQITENTIELFAEQITYYKRNARLVKLIVDKTSKELIELKPILELNTHLSYPFIIKKDDCIYVLPENIMSGRLDLYIYDKTKEILNYKKTVINMPLADATIVEKNGIYYLFASKKGSDNSELFLWSSQDLFDNYQPNNGVLLKSDLTGSRMAGGFFHQNDTLYRFAQDCKGGYGKGILIYRVDILELEKYKETEIRKITPSNKLYSDGIHTLNFLNEIAVTDGYYLKYNPLIKLIKKIT